MKRLLLTMLLVECAWLAPAQTSIDQNNLIFNGGFDSGSTDWSTYANRVYFYSDGSENILSIGWTNGCNYVLASGPFGSCQSSNAALVVLPAATPLYTAAVNPNLAVVDRFDGWGTSLCWWANVCGGYSNRNNYASQAFTTLGLNLVRYNIGGGENPGLTNSMEYRAQMQGFEPTNGVWNWNADAN